MDNRLQLVGQSLPDLAVHVGDVAVLVVDHDVNHRVVEDGLIAQHRVAHLLLPKFFIGHVARRADDVGGMPVLVAAQHGQRDGQTAVFSIRTGLCMHTNGLYFYLLLGNLVEGVKDATIAVFGNRIEEEAGRDILTVLAALLVEGGNGLLGHVVYPDMHLARLQDQRQTVVAAPYVLGHLTLQPAIDQQIDNEHEGQHQHHRHDNPDPRRDA